MYSVDEIVNRIFCGHSLEILRQFPDESVHMSMTSPPYWGKRDYSTKSQIWGGNILCEHEWITEIIVKKGHPGDMTTLVGTQTANLSKSACNYGSFCNLCGAWKGQLGLEPSPELYISHLILIFDEVKRVLRKDGSCFVNIGETYYGSGGSIGHTPETKNFGRKTSEYDAFPTGTIAQKEHAFLQAKSMCCIPEMFVIEMLKRGWILRSKIIWHKPNCTPESADDRFTNDFEHIFFFVKNNNPIFWTNEKTLKLITRHPRTSIEGMDWEWQPCKKCAGTGFGADGDEEDKCQRSLESFFEENEVKEEKQNMPCKKCSGTGKVKNTLWTGHDYYFEQQFEPYKMNRWGGKFRTNENVKTAPTEKQCGGQGSLSRMGYDCYPNPFGRNMRSVWTIKVSSFKGAHFAVYPEELCTTPIKAGCPEFVCKNCGMPRVKILKSTGTYIGFNGYGSKTAEHIGCSPTSSLLTKQVQEKGMVGYSDCGCNADFEPGIVLDPFSGSGTTAYAALKLGMRFIGIDTNPEYVKMAYGRIKPFLEQRTIADV